MQSRCEGKAGFFAEIGDYGGFCEVFFLCRRLGHEVHTVGVCVFEAFEAAR